MKRLSVASRQWISRNGGLNDRERARLTADKCRFWITAWEAIRMANGGWFTTGDLVQATGKSIRQCRRLLLRLAATGLCEMREGYGAGGFGENVAHQIRLRKAE